MEWPIAGYKNVIDKRTGEKVRRIVGGKMGPNGVVIWGQCKTALVQICDERLVVLIHVWDMNGMFLCFGKEGRLLI